LPEPGGIREGAGGEVELQWAERDGESDERDACALGANEQGLHVNYLPSGIRRPSHNSGEAATKAWGSSLESPCTPSAQKPIINTRGRQPKPRPLHSGTVP
jgi:hypothetical protein